MNEDRVFARAPLFAVADGMGGAQAGEVAAQIAIDQLQDGLPDGPGSPEERLTAILLEANALIHDSSRADSARSGMGTTFTAAYLDADGGLAVAHVGDSRLYCLRDGELQRLTRDHSLVEELVQEGRITAEEADEHPQSNIVTRVLGPWAHVDADHMTWRAQAGDVYLICSDGLTGMVPQARVAELLAAAGPLEAAGRALVAAANEAGGRDNITVVLFRLEDVGGADAGAAAEEHTLAGGSAPSTAAVRAAVAAAPPAGRAPRRPPPSGVVARRVPREPTAPPSRRRRRGAGGLKALAIFLVVGVPVVLGAFIASQSVYFVGTNGQGYVTLYRGLPYDLPAGVALYTQNYTSGVPTTTLPAKVRDTVGKHDLRSRKDGADLVEQIELGRLAGQVGG